MPKPILVVNKCNVVGVYGCYNTTWLTQKYVSLLKQAVKDLLSIASDFEFRSDIIDTIHIAVIVRTR